MSLPPAGATAGEPAGAGSTPYGYGIFVEHRDAVEVVHGHRGGQLPLGRLGVPRVASAGSRLISSDHTTLKMNTSIESPST